MKRHLGFVSLGLLSLILIFSLPAAAETLLIDCDLPVGPLFQVHIVAQSDGLKVREFKKTGEIIQRELMPWEWTGKRVKLTTTRPTDRVILQKVGSGWMLKVEIGSFKYDGFADCDQY